MTRWLAAICTTLLTSPALAQISLLDDLGEQISLADPAQRIISLSPHITETLFAIGAGERIVGTVMYSDYPEAASQIPVIGSFNELSYESVLSLRPDLVIAWQSGNGAESVARLRRLGLTVFQVEPGSLDDVADSIEDFGQLTGLEQRARGVASQFRQRLQRLEQLRQAAAEGGQTQVRVFYQVWNEPLTTLNGRHLISDIIKLCGGENVFASAIPIAPVVSVESVLQADPELIVASGLADERPVWLDDWRDWPDLLAVSRDQLVSIPPDILQRHSPRVIEGAEALCGHVQQARAAR